MYTSKMGLWANFKNNMRASKKEKVIRKQRNGEIRKKAEEAYYKASAVARIEYAKYKAKIEQEAKQKKLKAKLTRPPITFKGVSQDLARGFNEGNSMVAGASQPYFKEGNLFGGTTTPSKPKRKVRRKTSSKKSKYIIRGGKAYPVG